MSNTIMVLAHNMASMSTNRQLGIVGRNKSKSSEKLASGYRINRAADDAAGLAISEKMRSRIRALDQGAENTQDGISFVQIGDGAMSEINDMLHRMTELSIKSANSTMSDSDRAACDSEIQELKNEINRISVSTKFNEIPIFENPKMDNMVRPIIEGIPGDFSVYNSSYNSYTGKAAFGGILFHDERISWDKIDPEGEIAYIDSNGNQRFHEGRWTYTTQSNSGHKGTQFNIICEEGAETPYITRNIRFEGDEKKGFSIDGEWHPWSDLKNGSGESFTNETVGSGFWSLDYYGSTITLEFLGISDLKEAADTLNEMEFDRYYYGLETTVVGTEKEAAATAYPVSGVEISNSTIETVLKGQSFTLKASKSEGLWLLDGSGNTVSGSKRSWADLGIKSWTNGSNLNSEGTYYYTYSETSANPNFLQISFSMSDITSADSLVSALNGIKISETSIDANSIMSAGTGKTGNVSVISSGSIEASLSDEYKMGRNFNTKVSSGYKTAAGTASGLSLSVKMHDGLTLNASSSSISSMNAKVSSQVSSLMANKITDVINGNNAGDLSYIYDSSGDGISFSMNFERSSGSGSMNVKYAYLRSDGSASSYASSLYNAIGVSMVETDSSYSGSKYEKISDSSTATGYHYQKVSSTSSSGSYYRLKLTDNNTDLEVGNNSEGWNNIASSFAQNTLLPELAAATKIKASSDDYSTMTVLPSNKASNTVRPVFEAFTQKIPVRESYDGITIHHSDALNDKTLLPRFGMNSYALGLHNAGCKTMSDSLHTIDLVSYASESVAKKRAMYGALQNRYEHAININKNTSENLSSAESVIRDTDMAEEMVRFSKNRILEQTGQAMLTQASKSNQGILSLLR